MKQTKRERNANYRYSSHIVSKLTAHIVWITKYRYKIIQWPIKPKNRELIIQICDAEDVKLNFRVKAIPSLFFLLKKNVK